MKRGKFVGLCIIVFIIALIVGVAIKFVIKPAWSKKYNVE